jgi:putative spermidine/putrescine transport system permease protein
VNPIGGSHYRRRGYVLLLPLMVFLTVFFALPLVRVFQFSFFNPEFTFKNYLALFETNIYIRVFVMTLRLAFTVTLSCLLLGYPVAYLMANVRPRVQRFLMVLVIVPFWTSLLVRTYAWMILLQRSGLLNNFLLRLGVIREPLRLMYNTFGVNVGMINILLPFMIMTMHGVMSSIDKNLLKASQNLGASPLQSFLRVYFPLSLPGVTGGGLLVFVGATGFYITPALMGGLRDFTVSVIIETTINKMLNWGLGSALAVVLLLVTLGLVFVYNRYLGLDNLVGGKRT